MVWIEAVAALLGLASVLLMARQQPLAWPVGLVMVLLYTLVFWNARLYSDMLLQCVYAVLQLYGWWCWMRGGESAASRRSITHLRLPQLGSHLAAGAVITLLLGWAMSTHTAAAHPWLDAALTGLSLVGQYWMAHKRVQCWPLWVLVDCVYVGLYLSVALHLTALLYLLFVGLALYGWRQWQQAAHSAQAVPA